MEDESEEKFLKKRNVSGRQDPKKKVVKKEKNSRKGVDQAIEGRTFFIEGLSKHLMIEKGFFPFEGQLSSYLVDLIKALG